MPGQRPENLATTVVSAVALVAIVAVGVHLRLQEPLSSPSLAAEDPFTHVVFAKEALERGWFGDSWYLGTQMYPPGLHALSGILAPLSGITLYDFARFSPVVFGVLAMVGMYILGARLGGAPAGLASALAMAVMPEVVFRQEMYAPTALDLALVPAFLFLFWVAATSEEWLMPSIGFALLSIALGFTHPWLVPLFALPGIVAVALTHMRTGASSRDVARRLVVPAGLAAFACAFAMASRWTDSGTGFADFFAKLGPLAVLSHLDMPGPILFVALLVILGAASVAGIAAAVGLAQVRARVPRIARIVIAALLAAYLLWRTLDLGQYPGPDVNYTMMMGSVPIMLAFLGVAIALLFPTALGDLGLATCVLLFPLTAINVFHSQFWPARTVAYLCVGVALLVGATVSWAVKQSTAYVSEGRLRRIAAPTAVLLSVVLLGSAVATHVPQGYAWYHLYTDEQFAGFQRTAGALSTDPQAKVITTEWQNALLIKTLALPSQARYSTLFWKDAGERQRILGEDPGHAKYLIVDKYVQADVAKNGGDINIPNEGGWKMVYRSSDGGFMLYQWTGG